MVEKWQSEGYENVAAHLLTYNSVMRRNGKRVVAKSMRQLLESSRGVANDQNLVGHSYQHGSYAWSRAVETTMPLGNSSTYCSNKQCVIISL